MRVVKRKLDFLKVFFIEFSNEQENILNHEENLIKKYLKNEGYNKEEYSGEAYEKTGGDKDFRNYLKQIQKNPGQILRYLDDEPLLIHKENIQVPNCEYCGSERVFEFQLLSTIIYLLEPRDNKSTNNLDFSNVCVYTCRKCCNPTESPTIKSEYCFVERSV